MKVEIYAQRREELLEELNRNIQTNEMLRDRISFLKGQISVLEDILRQNEQELSEEGEVDGD